MGDPELRSDETVLVRTQGVYVKSIPFEGLITNKRIILIDRTKNLSPLKEIPLATIKDIESGENAFRDPVVTVTVITRSAETRQMILTFSRAAGGNRIGDRDEWIKTLKENVSSSYEQVIRKVIPGSDQLQKKPKPGLSPRIEKTGSQTPSSLPRKEPPFIHPIKKIMENAPSANRAAVKDSDTSTPAYGIFCTRCGNKVPEDSGFCNICGSAIFQPGTSASPVIPEAQPAIPASPVQIQNTEEQEIPGTIPVIGPSESKGPAVPPGVSPDFPPEDSAQRSDSPHDDIPPEPVKVPQPVPVISVPQPKPPVKRPTPRLFSSKELSQTPLNPASMPGALPPAPQKPRGSGFMPGKNVFIAAGVVILLIIIAVAGIFVYPMIMGSGSVQPGSSVPVTTTTSPSASSGTIIIPAETAAPVVPATGIYAHISYLGSWKGTYGMPSDVQNITDSGDRFYEMVNVTGPVEASFEKLDSSPRHELMVEIYKNGGLLTSGKTSAGFGKVTVSADVTTGIAQPPKTGTGAVTTTAPVAKTTTSSP